MSLSSRRCRSCVALWLTFALGALPLAGCGGDDDGSDGGGEVPAELGDIGVISAGDNDTCITNSFGKAFCWGDNAFGQLGDGTHTSHAVAVAVVMPSDTTYFDRVRAGNHACAMTQFQRAYCWGDGTSGALGTGSAASSATPQPTAGDHLFGEIDVGGSTCSGGDAPMCWGANDAGQLGTGDVNARLEPTPLAGGPARFRFLGVGARTACGVDEQGGLWCWGDGTNGELGNGAFDVTSTTPVQIAPDKFWVLVDVGGTAAGGTVCAVTDDYTTYCWGANESGQVGDGTTTRRNVPTPVSGLGIGGEIHVGAAHACSRRADAKVFCWGAGGVLGNGSSSPSLTPVEIAGGRVWSTMTIGARHACARTDDTDEMFCWGHNESGQLGDGTHTNRLSPVRVLGQP